MSIRNAPVWVVGFVAIFSSLEGCGGESISIAPDVVADAAASIDANANVIDAPIDAGIDANIAVAPDANEAPQEDAAVASSSGFLCPTVQPNAGDPCVDINIAECEYGSSEFVACNVIADCMKGGWRISPTDPDLCTKQTARCSMVTIGIDGTGCVADTTNLDANACDVGDTTCVCTWSDVWACNEHGTDCPMERPRIGAQCTLSEIADCDYADGDYDEGAMMCLGGNWWFGDPKG
jgi:hypothetical protein